MASEKVATIPQAAGKVIGCVQYHEVMLLACENGVYRMDRIDGRYYINLIAVCEDYEHVL